MRLRLSPAAFRRVTWLALAALVFIVITGGAVRLTGSGLGCTDWPNCTEDRLVAPLEYHAMIEFVNRMVTGVVSVAVIVAVLGALRRVPRRRDLTLLALGLVAGVLGQIVLGGLTVLFHLHPALVMGHFLLSMVLVANAVVLHERAGYPERATRRPVVSAATLRWGNAVLVFAAVAIFTGTIVTASGPHGGDEEVHRLGFALRDVARVHGGAVVAFLAVTIATLFRVRREGASSASRRRGFVLLAVIVAQAGVGYAQYFTGVPPLLVGIHIAGATAVWIASLRFRLGLAPRVAKPEPAPVVAAPVGQPATRLAPA